MTTLHTRSLTPGMTFEHDLIGPDGLLLLAAGKSLTQEEIHALSAAHVESVQLAVSPEDLAQAQARAKRLRAIEHQRDVARARAAIRRAAEEIVAVRSPRWSRLALRVRRETPRGTASAFDELGVLPDVLDSERDERVALVDRMYRRLIDGHAVGAAAPISLVDELMANATTQPGETLWQSLRGAAQEQSLGGLAYSASAIAVLCAVRMGWSDADVRAAGLAALFADCGMALLPSDVRHCARELTDVESNAMQRHPAYSAALLELVKSGAGEDSIPECVQLSVYQHHERNNAGGYPRHLRGEQIHDVAKLVGIVTTFVGVASERADRPAQGAHAALREVARLANAGAFDAEMTRALVGVVGVYPMGSRVKLSTGHVAVVVGPSAGGHADRPVVRVVAGGQLGETINLARWPRRDVAVVGVAA